MIIESDLFIEHFGVKGMQWGVRKEQKQEKRDAKAQKFTDKANELKRQIDEINSNKGDTPFARARNNTRLKNLNEDRNLALQDAQAKREGKLSHTEKKVLKGAAVAAAVVVVVGTYRMSQSGELNRIAIKGKDFLHGSESGWSKNPDLAKAYMGEDDIMSKVVSQINPNKDALGAQMNCRRCTFAYEMRRRGNDVAATRTLNGRGQTIAGVMNATTPDQKDLIGSSPLTLQAHLLKEKLRFKRGKISTKPLHDVIEKQQFLGKDNIEPGKFGLSHSIFEKLKNEPDGARGELSVAWNGGGGHSVAWEIVHGKPVIFDTQTGKKFNDSIDLASGYERSIASAATTRLDNLPMNNDFLKRWLKNA